ncbi:thiolase C-terminal domain-containing protein [Vineibacter terrae]|uniref:thiolase C-terminal domain-containing protein n=1 Tax=Vineibacter terrae TaxID=2586908 RepID=UPI002E304CD6|nr:thiolase [Vineibacter terrae]HEX2885298.1 thiolase [Vineibacter terrae]
MRKPRAAIVGAAETTQLGVIPGMSQLQLHCDAALNALADAGLTPKDIDGIACAEEMPWLIAHQLGITPTWVDGTDVGGCSYIMHLSHAAAAIEAGLCTTVLITHGESGRSQVGVGPLDMKWTDMHRQFELPFGVWGPPSLFTIPVLRYMKTYGLTEAQLANVAVVQRQWAALNPRATLRAPTTVDEILNSRMVAYPFRKLMCCLVTDGGGALIVTAAERARDRAQRPVYLLGSAEALEMPMISQMENLTSSKAFRVSGHHALARAGVTHADVDHLMIYDAFAHLPIYGLEDLGFVKPGEAGAFIAEGRTAPGGELPTNTNGGGLCYMHSGRYGMYALQEGVRQMRGTAAAQVPGAEISVVHGVGGMFGAAATAVLSSNG